MKKSKFDFGGWATRNDLLCADGRTIRRNAFKDDDGRTVPLVWQHNHEDPTRVIGHALLENREDGVYAYGTFNNTDIAQHVKELVRHGDVNSLSIFANKLKQSGDGDVTHGVIREVSVVLAGANPGAMIEFQNIEHGYESEATEAVIWNDEVEIEMGGGMNLKHAEEEAEEETAKSEEAEEEKPADEAKEEELQHEDKSDDKKEDVDPNETVQDVLNTLNDEQKQVVEFLVGKALEGDDEDEEPEEVSHADKGEKTVQDVMDSMTDKQRKVVEYIVAQALEARDSDAAKHSIDEENEEENTMNLFENNGPVKEQENNGAVLTHAQLMTIDREVKDGKKSMRDVVLAHSQEYGIENIEYLMPEYREYRGDGAPQFIKREDTWVAKVMNGVHHTPFSKVKMTFADITADEARARGYIKGNRKKEEVFSLLKREVSATMVYKKQKIDKDDEIDLSNGFDVVAWLKSEMRMMLNEELARAFIIGDGRAADSDDKIREDRIIPVLRDDDLFVIRQPLVVEEGQPRGDALVDAVTYAFEKYQGSGNCVAFMTRREHSGLKLLKDKIGHRIYKNDGEISSALNVGSINFMPQMGETTTVRVDATTGKTYRPIAIILDLDDYNVGADKGGSINMFEDFDIDYNQMKYLIETKCSGALTKPFSAIVIEEEVNP
jgi:HK97 family phage prohead protease